MSTFQSKSLVTPRYFVAGRAPRTYPYVITLPSSLAKLIRRVANVSFTTGKLSQDGAKCSCRWPFAFPAVFYILRSAGQRGEWDFRPLLLASNYCVGAQYRLFRLNRFASDRQGLIP